MARRQKRRARARRAQRRAARRDRPVDPESPPPPPRLPRPRLSREHAQRLLGRKPIDPATALLARFTDPHDPLLRYLGPLVDAAARLAPRLLDHPALHQPLVLLSLRQPDWIRPLARWRPPGRGRDRHFRSLVDHLLVRYPVPPFAYNVFWNAVDPTPGLSLFVHLAQGGSVRAATHQGLLPATLNRAMCHHLRRAPADATLVGAVRFAQVAGYGGEPWIARELDRTFLGRSLFDDADEAYWAAGIRWLCRDPRIEPGTVGHVVDYLRHRREQDPSFVVESRRLVHLAPQLVRWHAELCTATVQDEALPGSGLSSGRFEVPAPGDPDEREQWEVFELRDARTIAIEGTMMRHCVASYLPVVRRGTTSIWSLRRNGRRRATIEVSNRTRKVVQIKGRKNREPTARELAFVHKWARLAGLELARHP